MTVAAGKKEIRRICLECGVEKCLSEFSNEKKSRNGKSLRCKECLRTISKKWRAENPEYQKEYYRRNRTGIIKRACEWQKLPSSQLKRRKRYENNREYYLEKCKEYSKAHPEVNKRAQEKRMNNLETRRRIHFLQVKERAKSKGIEFGITFEEVFWPAKCPALGLELSYAKNSKGKRHTTNANTPSFDRTDPSKGYVRGNVKIISYRANMLKNNATAEELRAVLNYVESLNEQT